MAEDPVVALRPLLAHLHSALSLRTEEVVRDGRRRVGACEYCGKPRHHSTNGACDFRYNANIAADDVRTVVRELEALLAAVPSQESDADLPADSVRATAGGHARVRDLGVLVGFVDLLRQKKTVFPIHGHSTCAADPEVVLWRDVEATLAALLAAVPRPQEDEHG